MRAGRTIDFSFTWSSGSEQVKFITSCFLPVLLLLLLSITNGSPITPSSDPLRHGIRLQPELDKIDIDSYLKNIKALKIQVQCLIYDGPCDWVGRWLKPRVAAAILGECLLCTEKQKGQLQKIMDFIQANFPEEFKLGIKKYLVEYGIQVPTDEKTVTSTTAATTTTVTTTTTSATTTTTAKVPEVIVLESSKDSNSTSSSA